MKEAAWKTRYVSKGRSQLEYKVKYNHPELPWMVFFHGFGQESKSFEPIFEILQPHFNLLSVHIFFHGSSSIIGKQPLKKGEWKIIFRALLKKEGIGSLHITSFSMGCKFALTTLELMPERIISLKLLAPDGLVMNPWYRFATQTIGGRITLKCCVQFMPVFRQLIRMMSKVGMIKPALGKFATNQLESKNQKDLVLNVWLIFRNIWPDWTKIPVLVHENKILVQVILGKYDAIIQGKRFNPIKSEWSEFEWIKLESGHSGLVEKYAVFLKQNGT